MVLKMINYVDMSYRLLGNTVKSIKPGFLDIKDDLQRASINLTLEEYLSTAIFTTVLTFVAENVLLAFIFGFLTQPVTAVLMSLTLSSTISGLLFFLFYTYPATAAKSRGSNIKKVLPFAVSYLATIASSKLPPINMFETLSRFKEYGNIADEAGYISRDVNVFGMTFSSALKREAKRTPSKEFGELLRGINTVIYSGGDLNIYLQQRAEEFMNDYRRKIRKYSQDLSLFVEVYLTLIITGTIFFVVLSSVMSAISGGLDTIMIQTFVVFILLPLLSVGFVVIVKSISPTE
jgi:archaeal flagellar protein FlaJ